MRAREYRLRVESVRHGLALWAMCSMVHFWKLLSLTGSEGVFFFKGPKITDHYYCSDYTCAPQHRQGKNQRPEHNTSHHGTTRSEESKGVYGSERGGAGTCARISPCHKCVDPISLAVVLLSLRERWAGATGATSARGWNCSLWGLLGGRRRPHADEHCRARKHRDVPLTRLSIAAAHLLLPAVVPGAADPPHGAGDSRRVARRRRPSGFRPPRPPPRTRRHCHQHH